MESKNNPYKLDRTAFQAMTVHEADHYQRDYRNHTVEERLEVALYLTSIAYNFDMNHPPKMDKTIFSKSKQGDTTDLDDIDQLTKK
jgi:hypothetical protein